MLAMHWNQNKGTLDMQIPKQSVLLRVFLGEDDRHAHRPAHLQPGYTVTPADMWELEVLRQCRDTQIQYLYERELEFNRIAQSPSYRLARLLSWPLRKARTLLWRQ